MKQGAPFMSSHNFLKRLQFQTSPVPYSQHKSTSIPKSRTRQNNLRRTQQRIQKPWDDTDNKSGTPTIDISALNNPQINIVRELVSEFKRLNKIANAL